MNNKNEVHLIRIPKLFQELFGEKSTKSELITILFFCFTLSLLILVTTYQQWEYFNLWRKILLIILTVDITGGVVANITFSTNLFYKKSKKARLTFIAIHIQPLLLGLIFDYMTLCIIIWICTITATLLIDRLEKFYAQRVVALSLSIIGIYLLFITINEFSTLFVLLSLYIFKLVFSFAVDHYAYYNDGNFNL